MTSTNMEETSPLASRRSSLVLANSSPMPLRSPLNGSKVMPRRRSSAMYRSFVLNGLDLALDGEDDEASVLIQFEGSYRFDHQDSCRSITIGGDDENEESFRALPLASPQPKMKAGDLRAALSGGGPRASLVYSPSLRRSSRFRSFVLNGLDLSLPDEEIEFEEADYGDSKVSLSEHGLNQSLEAEDDDEDERSFISNEEVAGNKTASLATTLQSKHQPDLTSNQHQQRGDSPTSHDGIPALDTTFSSYEDLVPPIKSLESKTMFDWATAGASHPMSPIPPLRRSSASTISAATDGPQRHSSMSLQEISERPKVPDETLHSNKPEGVRRAISAGTDGSTATTTTSKKSMDEKKHGSRTWLVPLVVAILLGLSILIASNLLASTEDELVASEPSPTKSITKELPKKTPRAKKPRIQESMASTILVSVPRDTWNTEPISKPNTAGTVRKKQARSLPLQNEEPSWVSSIQPTLSTPTVRLPGATINHPIGRRNTDTSLPRTEQTVASNQPLSTPMISKDYTNGDSKSSYYNNGHDERQKRTWREMLIALLGFIHSTLRHAWLLAKSIPKLVERSAKAFFSLLAPPLIQLNRRARLFLGLTVQQTSMAAHRANGVARDVATTNARIHSATSNLGGGSTLLSAEAIRRAAAEKVQQGLGIADGVAAANAKSYQSSSKLGGSSLRSLFFRNEFHRGSTGTMVATK